MAKKEVYKVKPMTEGKRNFTLYFSVIRTKCFKNTENISIFV